MGRLGLIPVIVAIFVLGALALPTQACGVRGLSTITTFTFPNDTTTLYYDEGPRGSQSPGQWWGKDFDDRQWDPVVPVANDVQSCMRTFSGIHAPGFWGAEKGDYYVFRHRFTVPSARNYYHSTLYVGATPRPITVYFNEHKIRDNGPHSFQGASSLTDVSNLVVAGSNVLAIRVGAGKCEGLAFTLNLSATGVQTGTVPISSSTPSTSTPPSDSTGTVFGQGAEIHLSPSYAHGTSVRVTVTGLGWPHSQKISLYAVPIGGVPGGSPLATAVVDQQGRFTAIVSLTNPGPGATPLFIVAKPASGQAVMTPFLFD